MRSRYAMCATRPTTSTDIASSTKYRLGSCIMELTDLCIKHQVFMIDRVDSILVDSRVILKTRPRRGAETKRIQIAMLSSMSGLHCSWRVCLALEILSWLWYYRKWFNVWRVRAENVLPFRLRWLGSRGLYPPRVLQVLLYLVRLIR